MRHGVPKLNADAQPVMVDADANTARRADPMAVVTKTLNRFYLPDWAFLPLAAGLAAALIVLALNLSPGNGTAVVSDTGFVVQGEALADLVAGPGTSYRFDPAAPEGPAARIRASASFELAGNLSAGVAAFAPTEFETRISGRRIRVEIEARTAGTDGQQTIMIAYFIVGHGGTGWREVTIGPEYSTVQIEWDGMEFPPSQYTEAIGVWPDVDGQNREILVRRMRVEILPDQDMAG